MARTPCAVRAARAPLTQCVGTVASVHVHWSRSAPAGCVARPRGARGGVQSTRGGGRRPVACLLALDRCLLIENEGSSLGGPPDCVRVRGAMSVSVSGPLKKRRCFFSTEPPHAICNSWSSCGAIICKWALCTTTHNLVLVMLLHGMHTICGCSGAVEHGHDEGLCIVFTCSWCVANFGVLNEVGL